MQEWELSTGKPFARISADLWHAHTKKTQTIIFPPPSNAMVSVIFSIYSVVFSTFGPKALKERISDSKCTLYNHLAVQS